MRPWKTLSCLVPDVADLFHHPAVAQNAQDPTLPFDALDDTASVALELRQLLGVDVIRWRRIISHEVAQIKEHLVGDTRAYVTQLPPHGKETYEGRICPNVPLLRHFGRLSYDRNIAELMDYVAGGVTLFGRLHQGECWDRQPEWLLARPLDKSAFFTFNADHVTNAIKTRPTS